MKHVMAWRQGHDETSVPEFIVLGSAKCVHSHERADATASRKRPGARSTRRWCVCGLGDTADARQTTIRCSNDELGVWVAGADLPSLLAPHSSWTSIVPYKREAVKPYSTSDVPWCWPAYASQKGLRATGIDGDDLDDWQR